MHGSQSAVGELHAQPGGGGVDLNFVSSFHCRILSMEILRIQQILGSSQKVEGTRHPKGIQAE